MKKKLYSLSTSPPRGFTSGTPTKKNLLVNCVGLHADSFEQALVIIRPLTNRIYGVVFTPGEHYGSVRLGPNLWHVTFSKGMFEDVHDLAVSYLDMILQSYDTMEELRTTQIEYRECQESLQSTRQGYNAATDKLMSKIKEIRHLQQFLTDILNCMPSVIVGIDLDGVVTHWNLRAEEETGKTSNEVLGKHLNEIPSNLYHNESLIMDAIRSDKPKVLLQQKIEHRGAVRYVDVTIFPLSDQSAVVRVDDVTEKVHMEEALIQSEKMQSVGTLAAGMAHEINNPLAAILQYLEVIGLRLSSDLEKNLVVAKECGTTLEAVQQYLDQRKITTMLERILDAGQRAAGHVNNMLSFSRQQPEGKKPHDMNEIVNRTIEIARNDFSYGQNYDFKRISIVKHVSPNVPLVVCEASQVQQVLLNLFTNAAHATMEKVYADIGSDSEGPKIEVAIETIVAKSSVQISIRDNGIGMDLATSRRIFEPFFTTKGVGQGTGLGLSVCYYIVTQQHNGELAVESEQGRGTTFYIRLPLQPDGPIEHS